MFRIVVLRGAHVPGASVPAAPRLLLLDCLFFRRTGPDTLDTTLRRQCHAKRPSTESDNSDDSDYEEEDSDNVSRVQAGSRTVEYNQGREESSRVESRSFPGSFFFRVNCFVLHSKEQDRASLDGLLPVSLNAFYT